MRRTFWMAAMLVMVQSGLAGACGFERQISSEMVRVQHSEDIFVGRVVGVEVVERERVGDKNMELVAVQVLVEETLKGDTSYEDLTTLYLVVEARGPVVADSGQSLGGAFLSALSFSSQPAPQQPTRVDQPIQVDPYYGYGYALSMGTPELPKALGRFVFFAKGHGDSDSSFVLSTNDGYYMSPLNPDLVKETRRLVGAEARGDIYAY